MSKGQTARQEMKWYSKMLDVNLRSDIVTDQHLWYRFWNDKANPLINQKYFEFLRHCVGFLEPFPPPANELVRQKAEVHWIWSETKGSKLPKLRWAQNSPPEKEKPCHHVKQKEQMKQENIWEHRNKRVTERCWSRYN